MAEVARRLRVILGGGYRHGLGVAQRLDPTRLALRPLGVGTVVGLACVYRSANAPVVRALLRQLPDPTVAALWCLDGEPPEDLRPITTGSGPGTRLRLLNHLVAGLPGELDALVLADDDVRFAVGDLGRLVEAGLSLQLDLLQPAHLASSWSNWDFVRRRSFTFARQTQFVEQGPLLVLSAHARKVLLPFPADLGMGWGVEARWHEQAQTHGLRLGIVDAVAVEHLSPPGRAYDRRAAESSMHRELAAQGLVSLEELQVVVERLKRPARPR